MDVVGSNLRIGRSLIYLGIVILIFLFGTVFGLVILGRWLELLTPPEPDITFVIATPGTPSVGPEATVSSSTESATPVCDATPADWRPYTLQEGDTLSELAARIEISQNRLMQANCMTSPDFVAGEVLYLPPPPTPPPCTPSPPSNWGVYIVQLGDTLFDLATERGITPDLAIRINCLVSTDIVAGQQLYLPVLPTPTPCIPSPSVGWGLYIVQTGNTLFGLATARGITTDEVIQVNCLTSSDLSIGQELFLPLLPTPIPPPTPVPLPPVPPTSAPIIVPPPPPPDGDCSPFSCAGTLPSFPFVVPDPNDFEERLFPPCQLRNVEYIDTFPGNDLFRRNNTELGQRRYFFVCNFSAVSAIVTRSDGLTQSVKILDEMPNPDLSMGEAKAVIEWPVLPFHPTGKYTLTVTASGSNQPRPVNFNVILPTGDRENILPVPPVGPPGTIFLVYYVNFDLNMPQFHLWSSEDQSLFDKDITTLHHRDSWQVSITEPLNGTKGWAVAPLPSRITDLQGTYVITSETRSTTYEGIWLRKINSP